MAGRSDYQERKQRRIKNYEEKAEKNLPETGVNPLQTGIVLI